MRWWGDFEQYNHKGCCTKLSRFVQQLFSSPQNRLVYAIAENTIIVKKAIAIFTPHSNNDAMPSISCAYNITSTPYVPKEKGYTHEEQYEIAEGILKASGAIIKHDVPAAKPYPCYTPSTDEIHLPPKEAFPSLGEYYATALHELAHWTGHKERLNRSVTGNHKSPVYAKEELRAELASTYLSLDLPMNPTNHAAYVQSWIKNLKENKMEIFQASTDARKIANYIKDFMPARFRAEELPKIEDP